MSCLVVGYKPLIQFRPRKSLPFYLADYKPSFHIMSMSTEMVACDFPPPPPLLNATESCVIMLHCFLEEPSPGCVTQQPSHVSISRSSGAVAFTPDCVDRGQFVSRTIRVDYFTDMRKAVILHINIFEGRGRLYFVCTRFCLGHL